MFRKRTSKQRDNDIWENNRLQSSGIVSRGDIDPDFEDSNQQNAIQISTHHLTPPFLDGSNVFTKQQDPVSAVKDPQSDLAVNAKKGSFLVQERRQQRERQNKTKSAASLVNTAIGEVLGVSKKQQQNQETQSNGNNNNKFKNSLNNSNEPKPSYESIQEQRKTLPAYQVKDQVLQVIRDNQVVIIIGETGSGKTTQLTQFLNEDGYSNLGLIGCTQPRRVAAMSVAKRVSEEMDVKLGQEVGYAIRFEDMTSSKTIIKYMTDGVLLREVLMDSNLDKYSCIIMDEAHERTLNTDVLLGLFKNILLRRRNLKLIITSATMNANRFSSFFGNAPQFTIPGRTFPVDIMFSKYLVEDYVESAIKQCLSIHLQSDAGDILIFMTGQEDIETTADVLKERLSKLDNAPLLDILPIYSSMPAELQTRIFKKSPNRKVIIATNIAETSLTVDGIKYVIDSGYSKLKVYNPRIGLESLAITPISQANANQRAGRAGRTGPGKCYRLYTESAMKEDMYQQTIPEIQRTNLSNTLLLLKSLNVNDLVKFPFLDAPPKDTITASLYELWCIGALDNFGNLTNLGIKMSKFPLQPSLSKLLINAAENGCSEEMIIIVSMLSVPSVFYRPKEREEEADISRTRFFVPESDHLTLLNVYSQWKVNNFNDFWCKKHFLHSKSLKRARDIKDQIELIMKNNKVEINSIGYDWDIVRKVICSGFFYQAAKSHGLGEYLNLRTCMKLHLHPTSALYGMSDLPQYVVYHELMLTTREFISVVTAVEPEWLVEFGSVFYSIKEKKSGSSGSANNSKRSIEKILENDKLKYEEMQNEKKTKTVKKQKSVVQIGGLKNRKRRGF